MICNKDLTNIILILFLPFQFQLLHDYYLRAVVNVEEQSQNFNVPFSQKEAANRIFFASGTIASVISVFIYYKIKKRRLFLSINFIFNAFVWIAYFGFNEKRFWISILLRIFNGMSCAVFHTIPISYLFVFVKGNYVGFYGYLISASMLLALALVYLLFTFIDYKIVAIIFAIQDIVLSGVIFFLPEIQAPSKQVTHDYVFSRHNIYNLFITVMLMVFQQFTGINIVLRKIPMLLEGIGLNMKNTLQFFFMDVVGFLSNLIGAFATVRVPRMIMWVFSSLGLCVGLILFTLMFMTDKVANWIGTLGAFLFYMFYGFGMGPIPWYFGGELFSDSLRIEAGAACFITNMVFTIIYEYIEKVIIKKYDESAAMILCTVCSLISIFFGVHFIPIPKKEDYGNDNIM